MTTELKETQVLLSQAERRLQAMVTEIEIIANRIQLAKCQEEKRILEETKRYKQLLAILFGNTGKEEYTNY